MILLRKRMTEKEFLIKLEKVHVDKYSLMQHHPFTSSINKITLKCNICKRYFSNIPYNIIYAIKVLSLNITSTGSPKESPSIIKLYLKNTILINGILIKNNKPSCDIAQSE